MSSITFVTVVNENYFHHLPILFHTIKNSFPRFNLIIYGVNLSNHSLSSDTLNNANIQVVNNRQFFTRFEFERAYCCNIRASALHEVASKLPDDATLIYVDVNLLILPALSQYIDRMDGDLAVSIDNNHPCYSDKSIFKFCWPKGPLGSTQFGVITAGIQIYKISQKIKELLKEYVELVDQKKLSWYAEQEGIFLLLKTKKDLNIKNIEKLLCIGRAPNYQDIVVYKKGGADNSFHDNLSAKYYYQIENIYEADPTLSNPELLFKKVTNINLAQRIMRRFLLFFRRK